MLFKSAGLALIAIMPIGPAYAAERSALLDAFDKACLTPQHDESAIAAAAAEVGAVEESNPDIVGQAAPMIETVKVRRWMSGDPLAKSQTDLLFAANSGTTLGAPSEGCLVLGFGDPIIIEQALDKFSNGQFIPVKEPGEFSILPPYRYWLVDSEVTGPAIFAASDIKTWTPQAPSGVILSLVRLDPKLLESLFEAP